DGHINRPNRRRDLVGQRLAQTLAAATVHEDQVLLQEDRAVQARGQDEMPFAQGARVAELVQDVFSGHLAHAGSIRAPFAMAKPYPNLWRARPYRPMDWRAGPRSAGSHGGRP